MATITSSGAVNQSITRVGRNEPFNLQVSRSQITGHTNISIFGYQSAVATTPIAVWENATAYSFPSSASVMTLVSTSGSDTMGVIVNGLNSSFAPISEVVTLNGTTGVNTVNSFFRINSLILASGNNAGTITAKASSVTYAQINVGIGKSQNSWYTVPAGYSFYLTRAEVSSTLSYAGSVTGLYQVKTTINPNGPTLNILQQPFVGNFIALRSFPFAYSQQSDLQFQASVSTGTAGIGIIIEGILIANDGTL